MAQVYLLNTLFEISEFGQEWILKPVDEVYYIAEQLVVEVHLRATKRLIFPTGDVVHQVRYRFPDHEQDGVYSRVLALLDLL